MWTAKIVLLCFARYVVGETVKLATPSAPSSGVKVLDAAFQGFSMELASFQDYAGNLSCVQPGRFFAACILNPDEALQTSCPFACYRT
jgi:hypothetical protein